jgi:hypothetical protein
MADVTGLYPYIQDTFNITWLLLGLFIAGVLEAFLWETKIFQVFNHPIQAEWFGSNKRWRGLISLPLTNVFATVAFQWMERLIPSPPETWISFSSVNWIEYGLLAGFVCNLAELPNSFVKRRLNISPGDESSRLFFWVDHLDSSTGLLLLWWLYFRFPGELIATGIVICPLLFISATWIRKRLKLKD